MNILGEVASAPVANWLVQMALVASLFTLFTHHAKTTEDLVVSLRNALLLEGGFHNERVATEQVVDTINFDIHMKKSEDGHRFIERITEIIPQKENLFNKVYGKQTSDLTGELYLTRDIVVFDGEKYVIKECPSKNAISRIASHLSKEEQKLFFANLEDWRNLESEQ